MEHNLQKRRRQQFDQRVKLSDVAREAGVSSATVSRVLNNPDLVSAEVRSRVFQAIARLGYVPDGNARALAMQRSRTIGAIVPTIEGSIFARALSAFQHRLDQDRYTLLLGTTEYHMDKEYSIAQAFVERGVEGVMLVGDTHPPELYDLLNGRNIPYVNTVLYRDGPHPCCGYDHSISTAQIVQYLVGLGHRRFGLVTGIASQNDRVAARTRAAIDAAASHGVIIGSDDIVETEYQVTAARAATERLLKRADRPTAILCGNDLIALGAMACSRGLGLDIPKDVSIVGHGELDIALELQPSLTTIRTPDREIGRSAAEYLLARARGLDVPKHTLLNCEICFRESTGAAANLVEI